MRAFKCRQTFFLYATIKNQGLNCGAALKDKEIFITKFVFLNARNQVH